MKNILQENMKRFGTKNLHETNDESANNLFAHFLKREYYDAGDKSALAIAYGFMLDTDSKVAPSYVKNIFKTELGIDIPIKGQ